MGKDLEPNERDINKMIKNSGAASEEEFENNLLENWDIVKCCVCANIPIKDKCTNINCYN